jgi:broad specificity phosphatase PhoE
MPSPPVQVSTIHFVRHGDRFDYANPEWVATSKSLGNCASDPPLSALGHQQAVETAAVFAGERIDRVLVSPYLRVIQTAVPTANAQQCPIQIEEGLAESHHVPGLLPLPAQRFAYFPQVDPVASASPLHTPVATPGCVCGKTGGNAESFPEDYFKRMQAFAPKLEAAFAGQNIVCFSHAASVALIAALTGCSLGTEPDNMKFAPCGVYTLRKVGAGPWRVERDGSTNPHVSANAPTTFPWGFGEKYFGQVVEGCSGEVTPDFFALEAKAV